MPRYYFDLYDDVAILDEEGRELPHEGAAREQAMTAARDLIAAQARNGKISLHHRIEVVDGDRRPVFTLPFSSAVEIEA